MVKEKQVEISYGIDIVKEKHKFKPHVEVITNSQVKYPSWFKKENSYSIEGEEILPNQIVC